MKDEVSAVCDSVSFVKKVDTCRWGKFSEKRCLLKSWRELMSEAALSANSEGPQRRQHNGLGSSGETVLGGGVTLSMVFAVSMPRICSANLHFGSLKM